MLKKIIQSKTAKNLFWVAFWGGNSVVAAILVDVLFHNVTGLTVFRIINSTPELFIYAFLVLVITDVLVSLDFLLRMILKDKQSSKKRFFILSMALIMILLALYRLILFQQAPDLSIEEYFKCTTGVIKQGYPFVISKTGVCIMESECDSLTGVIDCKDLNGEGGWKVTRNLSRDNFNFEEANCGTSMEDNCDGAWFLDIGDKTYFWWPLKGNGRLFEVDKETFRYLGHDQYEDKNGLIIKKTRVGK